MFLDSEVLTQNFWDVLFKALEDATLARLLITLVVLYLRYRQLRTHLFYFILFFT